jgi:multidrug efflux pump
VLSAGPGAGARNSIGIMLVSGMVIGTLFTLFVVPSIYMLVARQHAPEEMPVASPARLVRPSKSASGAARVMAARAQIEAAARRM